MGTQGIYTVTNSVILGETNNFIQVVPDDDAVISSRIIITGSVVKADLLFSATLADNDQPVDAAVISSLDGFDGIIRSAKLAVAFRGYPIVLDWGPGPVLVACGSIGTYSVTIAAISTMAMIPKVLTNANTLSAEDEG